MDGVECIALLLGYCETGAPMPIEARRFMANAIRRTVDTGDAIDVSLGLSARGQRSLQTMVAMQRRNEWLVRAVEAVAAEGVDEWERCKRLAPLLAAFADGHEWRQTRYQIRPPPDWPLWKQHCWWAMATDTQMPTSPAQLRDIVRRNTPYSSHGRQVKMLASRLQMPACEPPKSLAKSPM
ncbi:hypothetical protein [Azoarcus olearius]|uniref:Uncharacterized protein n=1 Tax=Azoarcus sp. (strain BH72) TaxID=418699 RepID=A1K6N1_AZOSB|nr:hypothetical protein [Azoarcus olearius]CAL94486.1 Hypothetical protein azo1869 [Azoarcus olearius]